MRISSSLSGVDLWSQRSLFDATAALTQSALRLSTLRRINFAADDPAGLIASQALQTQLTELEAAQQNADRTAGVLTVADAGLSQASDLLDTIRENVIAASGNTLSDEEVAAHQVVIDAALASLDRIGATTSYGGQKLLDGSTLRFQLSTDLTRPVEITLPTVAAGTLGGDDGLLSDLQSGGSASLASGDGETALAIVDQASARINDARVRSGALSRYAVDASSNILAAMQQSIASAYSLITDTDVAAETSFLLRSQILVQSAVATAARATRRLTWIPSLLDETARS